MAIYLNHTLFIWESKTCIECCYLKKKMKRKVFFFLPSSELVFSINNIEQVMYLFYYKRTSNVGQSKVPLLTDHYRLLFCFAECSFSSEKNVNLNYSKSLQILPHRYN